MPRGWGWGLRSHWVALAEQRRPRWYPGSSLEIPDAGLGVHEAPGASAEVIRPSRPRWLGGAEAFSLDYGCKAWIVLDKCLRDPRI